jgi:micrococcal nuclease
MTKRRSVRSSGCVLCRVRLIGVDTPETKHPRRPIQPFGKEASAFTKQLVEGKEVRLEFGVQQQDK